MARTSYQTYLMVKKEGADNTFEKLIDIKDFPDLGKAPDTIDVTTLSDSMKVYLQDIPDTGQLEFTANYDAADYEKLAALAHKTKTYAVWFGATTSGNQDSPDGSAGKFQFDGQLAVTVKGGGVSSAVDMVISIAPSTKISKI